MAYGLGFAAIVIGSDILKTRFSFSDKDAGSYITLPYVMTATMMPFLGKLVDTFGNRMSAIFVMNACQLIGHIIYLFLSEE